MEHYKLRGHKDLRADFEAGAKYLDIEYEIIEDGDEIVIDMPGMSAAKFIDCLIRQPWRNDDETNNNENR